ncbi:helix-turn-helix transcriptional regulator [Taibaiella koreensis]|uniref:helix-turn-helix transcriptional regulator n=1 Tax=Taibaiella koreensis TaxID=1268548 RepID=UPI0013C2D095|nr:AraC family transcriptional regulator [Taibaiella koreensis]
MATKNSRKTYDGEGEQTNLLKLVNDLGYDIGDGMVQHVEMQYQKGFNFLPDLAMFAASYWVKKTFKRQVTPPKHIKNSIRFFFHNAFDYEVPSHQKGGFKKTEKLPYVRVFPSDASYSSLFRKGTHVKVVSIFISAGYLKSFLGNDSDHFRSLFEGGNNFLIEEMMTDDIIRTVNDIIKEEERESLNGYYYKLKALELLYYLFQSLSRREKSVHQKLNAADIKSIYKVRDKLASSLHTPSPIAELKQIAAMNELKMRRIFTQIFGMGIYDYYQHMRMKEAARLLREEHLSVSEAGYLMGFENLSHFARIFEKHIGKKPKKYSSEL